MPGRCSIPSSSCCTGARPWTRMCRARMLSSFPAPPRRAESKLAANADRGWLDSSLQTAGWMRKPMLLLQQVQACLLDLVNSFLSKAILRQADIDIFFFPFSARAEFFSEHVNFQPNFLLLVLGAFFFFFPPCLKNNGVNRVVSSQSLNLKAEASKVSKCIFDFMSKEKKNKEKNGRGFLRTDCHGGKTRVKECWENFWGPCFCRTLRWLAVMVQREQRL